MEQPGNLDSGSWLDEDFKRALDALPRQAIHCRSETPKAEWLAYLDHERQRGDHRIQEQLDWHDLLIPTPDESQFLDACIKFVISETRWIGDNWTRALICRRLKHCPLGRTHRAQLVGCITNRLLSGDFSEQFKDQLRLAMRLDPQALYEAAEKVMKAYKFRKSHKHYKPHVGRYAQWVLLHDFTADQRRQAQKSDSGIAVLARAAAVVDELLDKRC